MSTKTKAELAEAVLRHLTVIDATESPDSDDEAHVIAAYEDKFQEIRAHGVNLTYWKRDTIPGEVFLILRDLVALEVMPAFGQLINAADKEASEQIIFKRLRRHVSTQSSGLPVRATYF